MTKYKIVEYADGTFEVKRWYSDKPETFERFKSLTEAQRWIDSQTAVKTHEYKLSSDAKEGM